MEHTQVELFKTKKASVMGIHSNSKVIARENVDNDTPTPPFQITSTDHHVIEIVSTYIKKLPDNNSKKQLARIMINFIMKSANL